MRCIEIYLDRKSVSQLGSILRKGKRRGAFRTVKSFLDVKQVCRCKEEKTKTYVSICIFSLLIARLFEKAVKDVMTASSISEMLSELKAIPVKVPEGMITLRSESENARRILEGMNIPYQGRIVESVPT